jgi:ABC-type multidrug transport system fused ATPase/permease subunit
MLSLPTFKAQRRQTSGDMGSEEGSVFNSQRSIQPGGRRRSIEPGSSQRAFADVQDPATSRRSLGSKSAVDEEGGDVEKGKGGLIAKEDQEIGQIGYKVYWYYMRAYGLPSCGLLVFCWSSEQAVRVLTNWWLSRWTAAEALNQVARELGRPQSNDRARYIGGYFGFAIGFVVMTMCRSILNLYSAWRASRAVHQNSLHKLVGTHVMFFDTTPIGRILNRFSKDTDDMDYLLPQSVTELGNCLFQLLATLIFISIIQPYFLAGMVPLMGVYFVIQKFYRKSYIEMQRIDATTRSPIYAHFSETLTGVETLRAYGFEERFALSNERKVDYNHRAYFSLRMADQWLSWRLDCIAACLILIVAMLAISQRNNLSPSLTALSLTEVLDVTGFLKYAVQSAAMFESRFNSVERIMAYNQLAQEAPATIEATQPEDNWPTEGALSYRGVWMRYRPELPAVLKGVTFNIAAGEKVGICGRTGSGKSSLIVSLFRIVEPYQGSILMDGVDLLTLGLQEVRGRIAAIPQDPVLFSGTVRTNLDPFSKHTDAQLWESLGHVNLKEMVKDAEGGLEARVAEGGDNWSLGQRQLLCVARALLRKPRVLVADEATASVDGQTDALIQRTIRANFSECTCLTIAHRINTILDSNKVLVMDDGVVAEYAAPAELMQQPDSAFRSMVVEAGLGAGFGAEERRPDP